MFETALFYAFSAILLLAALRVITARNPVHSAMFLVLSFFTAAGIWLLLRAEFLAIALVLVYVGAVMVLFLFVVMMLDINIERLREGFWRNLPLAVVVGGSMVFVMVALLARQVFEAASTPEPGPGYSNKRQLGLVVYTHYAYAFEVSAVILLAASIAAISLTLRRRKDSRYQNPSEQVTVRREDRVRLVSMPAETDE